MTTGITKSEGSQDEGEPTDDKERDGAALPGAPGPEEADDRTTQDGATTDVRTQSYNGGSHKHTAPQSHRFESSPSAGWREVYFSMEVSGHADGQH